MKTGLPLPSIPKPPVAAKVPVPGAVPAMPPKVPVPGALPSSAVPVPGSVPLPSVSLPPSVPAKVPVPGSVPLPSAVPAKVPVPTALPPASVPAKVPGSVPLPSVLPPASVPAKVPGSVPLPSGVPAKVPVPSAVPLPSSLPPKVPVPSALPSTAVPAKVPVPSAVPLPSSLPPKVPGAPSVAPKIPSPKLPTVLPPSIPTAKVPSPKLSTALPPSIPTTKVPSPKLPTALPPSIPISLPPVSVSVSKVPSPKLPTALPPSVPISLPPVSVSKVPSPKLSAALPPSIPISLPPVNRPITQSTMADLVSMNVKERKEEVVEKIEKEISDRETLIAEKKTVLVGVPDLPPLGALGSAPIFSVGKDTKKSSMPPPMPVLPVPPLPLPRASVSPIKGSAVELAKTDIKDALLTEPEATFQPVSASPLAGIPDSVLSPLSQIASPANLPSSRRKDTTPKIRLPNIKSTPGRPSPMTKSSPTVVGGIELPTETTIIIPNPILSPSALNIPKVSATPEVSDTMLESIRKIDIQKLKNDGYKMLELKVIAGSLGLSKTGNKKPLTESILRKIGEINPSAFTE